MNSTTGILFALGALVGWGFGDFSIQRTTRAIGRVRALFYIGITGTIVLLPFVWDEIPTALSDVAHWPLMLFLSLLILITALLNFKALKLGKLSVIMPIEGIELLVALTLTQTIGHERYALPAYGLMVVVIIGIALISVRSFNKLKRTKWEKGVAYALAGSIGLGFCDFTVGFASRETSPLFAIWLTNAACMVGAAAIMLKRGSFAKVHSDFSRHFYVIMSQCFFDNLAWLSFAYSATLIPIGIASAVSEGYLALGALLGVAVNHERLRRHQYVGIVLTLAGVMALGYVTGL